MAKRHHAPPWQSPQQGDSVPAEYFEAHVEILPLLQPFWGKVMNWDSSEILFLEEKVPYPVLTL